MECNLMFVVAIGYNLLSSLTRAKPSRHFSDKNHRIYKLGKIHETLSCNIFYISSASVRARLDDRPGLQICRGAAAFCFASLRVKE